MSNLLWGVDLGGTKIEGVLLERGTKQSPEEVARLRIPTEQEQGYSHILNQITKLIRQLEEEAGQSPIAIGFGTPGVLDPDTHLLKNSNTECLRGQALLRDLQARLNCHIELANDANCFALAEARFGAGRGANCVFGVIMGTGVGGGIVIDGCARYGKQGIAGEFGHISLDPSGPNCYCGKKGCVETYIAGPSLEYFYKEQTGISLSLKEILKQVENESSRKTKARLLQFFGMAIASVVNILDPDCIVLGGGVSNIDFLYEEAHTAALPFVFNDSFKTPIVKNELGDSAGVYGAACLVA